MKLLSIATATVVLALSSLATPALAETEADIKNLQFSVRKLDSLQGLAVQFTPPAGHHFNMEAPTKISLKTDAKSTEPAITAEIDKTPAAIKASWSLRTKTCEITAQVYLCDDQNKYCVPIKKNFQCEKLTYEDVLSTNSNEQAQPAAATEKNLKKKVKKLK